jgi:hypothetical protein
MDNEKTEKKSILMMENGVFNGVDRLETLPGRMYLARQPLTEKMRKIKKNLTIMLFIIMLLMMITMIVIIILFAKNVI